MRITKSFATVAVTLVGIISIGIGCGKSEVAAGQDEQVASEAPVISEAKPGEITLALGTDERLIVTASYENVFVNEEDALVLPGETGMTDTFYRLDQRYSDGVYAGTTLRAFNVLTGGTDSFNVEFSTAPDEAFVDGVSRGRAAIEGMVPSGGGLLAYMQINDEGQETARYEVLLSTDGKVTGCTRIAGEPANGTDLLPILKNTSGETLSLSGVYDTKGMETMQLLAMTGTSDGRLALLYSHGRTSCSVYVLGHDTNVRGMPDGEDTADPLRILNFRSASDIYLEKCAAEFTRMTGHKVVMEHADYNDATALNKAVNDMKDGEGPDILIVDSRTLADVARAEVLQGLFEVLGEDVIDAIFPAVLGNGTVDGALRGIGYRASVRFFMANDDEYQGDTWTAQDICALKNNSVDGQIRYSTDWVRSDIILNRSHDKDEGHNSAYFDVGDNASIPLATKPDGSSYAKEYVDLMNAAIPASNLYELQDIITEESQAYMNGDKTAREAADIIQNRCKLWISENR